MKPAAAGGGGVCRSLINIDLAPKEAACRRADPGHPRCWSHYVRVNCSTQTPGDYWLQSAPKEKAPQARAYFLPDGSVRAHPTHSPSRQTDPNLAFTLHLTVTPRGGGLSQQGTQDGGQPVSGRAINPPIERPKTEGCFHPNSRLPCVSSEAMASSLVRKQPLCEFQEPLKRERAWLPGLADEGLLCLTLPLKDFHICF